MKLLYGLLLYIILQPNLLIHAASTTIQRLSRETILSSFDKELEGLYTKRNTLTKKHIQLIGLYEISPHHFKSYDVAKTLHECVIAINKRELFVITYVLPQVRACCSKIREAFKCEKYFQGSTSWNTCFSPIEKQIELIDKIRPLSSVSFRQELATKTNKRTEIAGL